MTKRPTVYDVAKKAGVSTATVSYAYRKPDRVGRQTLTRVMEVASELGYVPRSSARDLAVGRHDVLGLFAFEMLLEDPAADGGGELAGPPNPWVFPLYVDEIQRGFQLECARQGKAALIGSGREGDGDEIINIAGRVDGLAVLPGELSDSAIRQVAQNMPVVLFGRARGGKFSRTVTVDNDQGVQMLVDHMIDVHGKSKLEFVGSSARDEAGGRFRLFQSALSRRGMVPPQAPWAGVDVIRLSPGTELAERVRQNELPDALVCAQDQVAAQVVQALQDAGRRVPEDVAVVGFDGVQAGQLMTPALTTVRQPMEEMGRLAVQMLLTPRADEDERVAVLPARLLVRRSCGCNN